MPFSFSPIHLTITLKSAGAAITLDLILTYL